MTTKQKKKSLLVDRLADFEAGQMHDEKEVINLFQELVDTGLAWRLQGHYGRCASSLLEQGIIHPPKKKTKDNSFDFWGSKLW